MVDFEFFLNSYYLANNLDNAFSAMQIETYKAELVSRLINYPFFHKYYNQAQEIVSVEDTFFALSHPVNMEVQNFFVSKNSVSFISSEFREFYYDSLFNENMLLMSFLNDMYFAAKKYFSPHIFEYWAVDFLTNFLDRTDFANIELAYNDFMASTAKKQI